MNRVEHPNNDHCNKMAKLGGGFFILFSVCVVLAHSKCIYLDHLCGSSMENDARVTCVYKGAGIYTSHRIYEHIEQITMDQFNNASLDTTTFPALTSFVISSSTTFSTKSACEYIIAAPPRLVFVIKDANAKPVPCRVSIVFVYLS